MTEILPHAAGWTAAIAVLAAARALSSRARALWPGADSGLPGRTAGPVEGVSAVVVCLVAGAILWLAAEWLAPIRSLLWPYGEAAVTLLRAAALIPFAVLLAASRDPLDALWVPRTHPAPRAIAAAILAAIATAVALPVAWAVDSAPPGAPALTGSPAALPGAILTVLAAVLLADALAALILARLAPAAGVAGPAFVLAVIVSAASAFADGEPLPVPARAVAAGALLPLLVLRFAALGISRDLTWYAAVHCALALVETTRSA